MPTEIEKLTERLEGWNLHVSWSEKAKQMSPEQRAAMLNRTLNALDSGDYEEIRELD